MDIIDFGPQRPRGFPPKKECFGIFLVRAILEDCSGNASDFAWEVCDG